MNIHPFIVSSYTVQSQTTALTHYFDPQKSFLTRRIYGVVVVPFASVADAFRALYLGLIELKNGIISCKGLESTLHGAGKYFLFAQLFACNALLSISFNAINPDIYADIFPLAEPASHPI